MKWHFSDGTGRWTCQGGHGCIEKDRHGYEACYYGPEWPVVKRFSRLDRAMEWVEVQAVAERLDQ